MTREEAIELLEDVIGFVEDNQGRDYDTAFRMAIEALAERPTESDFISKAKVLETYSELYWFDIDCGVVSKAEVDKIYERLQSLPSADRPTGEWISEELANMICNEICYYKEVTVDADSLDDLCEGCLIKKMKYGRPTGWIPVSERLPEDIKPVIITWKNTDPASYYQYIVGKHFIGTGHYCNGKWFWYSSVCEDLLAEYGESDVDELDEAIEVIAWMPLPEPYKGGEEK